MAETTSQSYTLHIFHDKKKKNRPAGAEFFSLFYRGGLLAPRHTAMVTVKSR
jgi:hypothetical protein